MESMDLRIAEMKNQYRKEKWQDIHQEVDIKGEKIVFTEKILLDGQMSILLPSTFREMDPEIAKMKYPAGQAGVIMTSKFNHVDFTFTQLDEIQPEYVQRITNSMKNTIARLNPANVFYEEGLEPLGTSLLGYFTYKGYAINGQVYNVSLFTTINNKGLVGAFNCNHDDKEEWEKIAYQMMTSIKDLTQIGDELL